MVKRSRVRFPVKFLLGMTQDMKDKLDTLSVLTNEPTAEAVRRMIERETPLFLEHASKTGKLMNGEVA